MKTILWYVVALCSLLAACRPNKPPGPAAAEKPAVTANELVPLADPFILLSGGTYYAYGTHSAEGIEVYRSDDLKTWRYQGLALRKEDVWADRWFWAPEVYERNGTFYMYYSADEHICVATSASPLGPFRQAEKKPMLPGEKSIDHSLFVDTDGTPYLFFVRFTDGNNIWMARLEPDWITLRPETMRPCIHVSQPWEEVWPRVNEAPFVIRRNGIYYLTYSANSYESPMYGVGCATATDLRGEWTKYDENPLLQKPGDLVGVGHSALFTDKAGRLRIVFHAHRDSTRIHPRAMYIGTVRFQNAAGTERMRIGPGYEIPRLVK
ncbi:MAG: glycoside hydrolase family 43 protein [Parabacteroides sp.]|nr:glycoside hydrolase family 43 protein [Parabacteroides sp.]